MIPGSYTLKARVVYKDVYAPTTTDAPDPRSASSSTTTTAVEGAQTRVDHQVHPRGPVQAPRMRE